MCGPAGGSTEPLPVTAVVSVAVVTCSTNTATTLFGPSMVMVSESALPDRSPCHSWKVQPGKGMADMDTVRPAT